jgi:hypothetical protein
VHVLYKPDADVSELAETAARHHDNGVDVVVFTMGSPNAPSMVGALAEALDRLV